MIVRWYFLYYFQILMICHIYYKKMKVVESLLGFKDKKTPILQQRNSILKLLFIINVPNIILLFIINKIIPDIYMDE